jgi:hypothetical protein
MKFTVPIRVTHYPEYLKSHDKVYYWLPVSPTLSKMDERIKQLNEREKTSS